MRLIDIDAMSDEMYHLAFETDSDMQKWDGGCWIRYKMFEKCRDNAPTIDAEPIVRCKDCMNWDRSWKPQTGSDGDRYCIMIDQVTGPCFYCADAEKEEYNGE